MKDQDIFAISKKLKIKDLTIAHNQGEMVELKYENKLFDLGSTKEYDTTTLNLYDKGNKISRTIARPTKKEIEETLKEMLEFVKYKTKEVNEKPFNAEGLKYETITKSVFKPLDLQRDKNLLKDLTEAINKSCRQVIPTNTIVNYSLVSQKEYQIDNQGQKVLIEEREYFVILAVMFAKKFSLKGKTSEYVYYQHVFKTIEGINVQKIVDDMKEELLLKLRQTKIKSQKYEILFDEQEFKTLLNCFESHFMARSVIDKQSRWEKQLGKQIMSNKLTLIDKPLDDKCGTYIFADADGQPTSERKFVDKGVLTSFVHNAKTAKLLKQTNTGHSTGSNAAFHKLYLAPGTQSKKAIIEKTTDGILINSFKGLHSGTKPTSGDFSLEFSGNVIKNGKVGKAIKAGVISGNFFIDVLPNIEAVAKELNVARGFTSPMVKLSVKLPVSV